MNKRASRETIRDGVGDTAIVYGTPKNVSDGVVELKAHYVRVIGRRWVTTWMMSYGRRK